MNCEVNREVSCDVYSSAWKCVWADCVQRAVELFVSNDLSSWWCPRRCLAACYDGHGSPEYILRDHLGTNLTVLVRIRSFLAWQRSTQLLGGQLPTAEHPVLPDVAMRSSHGQLPSHISFHDELDLNIRLPYGL